MRLDSGPGPGDGSGPDVFVTSDIFSNGIGPALGIPLALVRNTGLGAVWPIVRLDAGPCPVDGSGANFMLYLDQIWLCVRLGTLQIVR